MVGDGDGDGDDHGDDGVRVMVFPSTYRLAMRSTTALIESWNSNKISFL